MPDLTSTYATEDNDGTAAARGGAGRGGAGPRRAGPSRPASRAPGRRRTPARLPGGRGPGRARRPPHRPRAPGRGRRAARRAGHAVADLLHDQAGDVGRRADAGGGGAAGAGRPGRTLPPLLRRAPGVHRRSGPGRHHPPGLRSDPRTASDDPHGRSDLRLLPRPPRRRPLPRGRAGVVGAARGGPGRDGRAVREPAVAVRAGHPVELLGGHQRPRTAGGGGVGTTARRVLRRADLRPARHDGHRFPRHRRAGRAARRVVRRDRGRRDRARPGAAAAGAPAVPVRQRRPGGLRVRLAPLHGDAAAARRTRRRPAAARRDGGPDDPQPPARRHRPARLRQPPRPRPARQRRGRLRPRRLGGDRPRPHAGAVRTRHLRLERGRHHHLLDRSRP